MIPLNITQARAKVRYHRDDLAGLKNQLKYWGRPDLKGERDLKRKIEKLQRQSKREKDELIRKFDEELIHSCQQAIKSLPQNIDDDRLAEIIVHLKELIRNRLLKLHDATEELEAYLADPSLVTLIAKDYENLPPDIKGVALFIYDDGTIVTDHLEVIKP